MGKTFLKKFNLNKEDILNDLRICIESRETGNIGRKEVFIGKASFGIFGEGKELPQIALAHFFKNGDFRSGYYRDTTLAIALEHINTQQFFAQLYAHTDIKHEPTSGGRMMTGNFSSPFLNEDGSWKELSKLKNSSADISPTAGQMPRLVGLALASKLFKENKELHKFTNFSNKGNEIAFGTIGDAASSEGLFFESINAAGVLQVPMLMSVWDDGYGISVPGDLQITKADISKILEGFRRNNKEKGYEIFTAKGWDYENLIEVYSKATKICREEHIPVLVHVKELTQPNGHSTSGSHERYKTKERLEWEKEHDCNLQFTKWIIKNNIATKKEVDDVINQAIKNTKDARSKAWKAFRQSINEDMNDLDHILSKIENSTIHKEEISRIKESYLTPQYPLRSHLIHAAKLALRTIRSEEAEGKLDLQEWHKKMRHLNKERYSGHLYNNFADSALKVPEVPAEFSENSKQLPGSQIINQFFDKAFEKNPRLVAFGEDVGKIGDVNQGFVGLQEKYGELRVTDTGIREATIIGQAIGLAMRGLRPIAEIQYLDYLMYALQIMSDDLATVHYRSHGRQKAPVIIRTRGHRLQGVWHSGSPLGTLINSTRGIYICVPRNMTQAAGMYNTLIHGGDPALVIECLNGYRVKETLPDNIGEYTVPLGHTETLKKGTDITIVTYGAMCNIVLKAAEDLEKTGISCEVIDLQTLVPLDVNNNIAKSIEKTNRVLFADEDVPGGSSAYLMQQIIEKRGAYFHLDAKPKTIHSWAHRPAYGTDGDYFSKPNPEDVFDYVYGIFMDDDEEQFPPIYLKKE